LVAIGKTLILMTYTFCH